MEARKLGRAELKREAAECAPDRALTSLVSYEERCPLWGDASYHGNCDGTLFKELVLRYGARRVGDPMVGSGTTRDVVASLNRNGHQIAYWGSDLKEGFDLSASELPGEGFDFIWVHPPYWDIVRYGESEGDLSAPQSYGDFLRVLGRCLRRCTRALAPGGHLAVLVADVRKQGRYYPLGADVMALGGIGELRSVIIKQQHNCRSDSKRYARMTHVPIKHEYCLVFERTA